jgi:hypothetical protein
MRKEALDVTSRWDYSGFDSLSTLHNISCLRTFLTLRNLELDLVAFLQALVTLRRNRAVVHEHVRAIRASDEAVALGVIEPLHRSFQTFHVTPAFRTSLFKGAQGRARKL